MPPSLRIVRGALNQAARGASPEKLRELADRDFEEAWNRVKALAGYAENETTRLQALELMLAYMVGRPVASVDIKTTPQSVAPFDTSQLTDDELRAYRVLANARDRLVNGGPVIDAPALPPLPPLK